MNPSFQQERLSVAGSYGPNVNLRSSPIESQESVVIHKRSYQACDPCRRRKVKCDLGSVDNPRAPPCSRCRRESKKCEFSVTRRKRKLSDYDGDEKDSSVGRRDDGNATGWSESTRPSLNESVSSTRNSTVSASKRMSIAAACNEEPMSVGSHADGEQALDNAAADLFTSPMNNPHDALHVLVEAAGRTEHLERRASRTHASNHDTASGSWASQSLSQEQPPSYHRPPNQMSIDPNILLDSIQEEDPASLQAGKVEFQNALQAWSKLRFVRAGWFTGWEAISYIQYYYARLAPLTPVAIPDYRAPSTHATLLHDEPVLTVTILTLASRYMPLEGRSALSRQYAIHEKLWAYLRGMIERLFWGQEEFSIGSYGALIPPSSSPSKGMAKASLRTLGTIEALLLLTDWHPRALHFPPSDDSGALVEEDIQFLPSSETGSSNSSRQDGRPSTYARDSRFAFASWLEPAWRSDRMCWMLLGNAYTLAFELGVFDRVYGTTAYAWEDNHGSNPPSHRIRADRLQRLLIVYITQTSGRLGISSMLNFSEIVGKLDAQLSVGQDTNNISNHPIVQRPVNIDDQILDYWMKIAAIMHKSNNSLFQSRERTRQVIRSGDYIRLLDEFQPLLEDFRRSLMGADIPRYMKYILSIEYNYTRLYINSLALQAVVERLTNIVKSKHNLSDEEVQNNHLVLGSQPASPVSPSVLREVYHGNERYISEVKDACRGLLTTVIEDLLPGDYLRHAPVRTYFRILSGAMFLLKTFAVGATGTDVAQSLSLINKLVKALSDCVVDDVHLSVRIADLLSCLTNSIQNRFIRLDPMAANSSTIQSCVPSPPPGSTMQTIIDQQRLAPGFGQLALQQNCNREYAVDSNAYAYSYRQVPQTASNVQSSGASSQTSIYQPISRRQYSFMPPPIQGPYSMPGQQSMENSVSTGEEGMEYWAALPLDSFFNNPEQNVDQAFGGIGPMVGDMDMLEVMLDQHFDMPTTNHQGLDLGGVHGKFD